MRRDLADVRLADRVFAPHYAAPVPRTLRIAEDLRHAREADSAILATLAPGDVFEVLEFAGDHAWGVAPGCGLVGYIAESALTKATS
ncbi:SH3 domain-containing protein [Sphingomonas immobilis]|uniref:SH3 domain-containing protein n=1 Tax=Sphingomonas immobilis TaxID=3063997 RepID=A0ABT9A3B4_9SPHN|nr:SH3 domain-containing protein [Sphingomonas sp. CA1-15]MDO7844334.1 SH3 domain-containing protein [Sphingomonas sp. CA1-15]